MSDLTSLEKLHLGVELAAIGLGDVDYLDDTIKLDEKAASFFDFPANIPVSRDKLHDRIHPDDRTDVESQVSCLLSPESEGFISVIHRVLHADGSMRWLSARKQVKFEGKTTNGDPKPVSGLVAIQDITEHKAAEARIQFLVGEIAHRSKNMLSVVQGIARLTARNSDPETFISRFTARLSALASNQSILVENKWTSIDLRRLAQSQLEPYSTGLAGRVTFEGPNIILCEKPAQSMGMALHELATNAVKYGALSDGNGTVTISWKIENEDETEAMDESSFVFSWTERDGPLVSPPTRKGFGETVIRQMASSSVGGQVTLDYDPEGVSWTLTAPLSNIALRT